MSARCTYTLYNVHTCIPIHIIVPNMKTHNKLKSFNTVLAPIFSNWLVHIYNYYVRVYANEYFRFIRYMQMLRTLPTANYEIRMIRIVNFPILQVSWIRKRDLHILTTGSAIYTSDQRFQVRSIYYFVLLYIEK